MESKSIIIHKGGKEEKYKLYVEDYVLSYLKYETGSLDFSEIYFYGTRQTVEKKYVIYGAGRDKQIPTFEAYELLEEVVCRLTQAGPVFMVREMGEIYQIKGFDIFYQDNEAMQNYMVECQHSVVRPKAAQKEDRHKKAASSSNPDTGKAETKPFYSYGIMSAQLGVILIILVAIVINSANSYDKMEQLNRSAEEVFFAIENQEAGDDVSGRYESGTEIVVERNQDQGDNAENMGEMAEGAEEGESVRFDEAEAANTENVQTESVEADGIHESDVNITGKDAKEKEEKSDTVGKEIEEEKGESDEEEDSLKAVSDDEGTEALSRNVTRYYEVERGDTLYTICQKIYGDTSQVKKICELNDISDPDRIRFGQKIILP